MFGIYAEARERGKWLAKHPAYPSLSPVQESGHYRCSEPGCGRSVVRSNKAQTGWAHLPRQRRKKAKPPVWESAGTIENGKVTKFVYTGPTHAFRPTPGNAVMCADCPPGDSVGEAALLNGTGGPGNPRHVGHEPVSLEVAVNAIRGIPEETLVAELRRRNLTHGTHNALRSYADPSKCDFCGVAMSQRVAL